jgi:hypothetical protein
MQNKWMSVSTLKISVWKHIVTCPPPPGKCFLWGHRWCEAALCKTYPFSRPHRKTSNKTIARRLQPFLWTCCVHQFGTLCPQMPGTTTFCTFWWDAASQGLRIVSTFVHQWFMNSGFIIESLGPLVRWSQYYPPVPFSSLQSGCFQRGFLIKVLCSLLVCPF